MTLPRGNFTSLMLLGASVNGHAETGSFQVFYTDNTSDTFTQDFSDWKTGYNGTLGTTAPGESVAWPMTAYDSKTGEVTSSSNIVDLYGYVFPLNPGKTLEYITGFNDNAIKILAIDEVYQPAQVNMGDATGSQAPPANATGITLNTSTSVTVGLDRGGNTYSANALTNTVAWNNQVFNIGGAGGNVNNVVEGYAVIPLPHGQYTSVQVLGTAANGYANVGTFIVDYTDNTMDSFNIGFSDWQQGYIGWGTTEAFESVALTMQSYNKPTGNTAGNADLYGYVLPVNPLKTVADLKTFNNGNIAVVAVDVVNQPTQVNLGNATNSANPAFDWLGITMQPNTNLAVTGMGIDHFGSTYSAGAGTANLNNTVSWNAQTFNVGPASDGSTSGWLYNVVAAGGQNITLPPGNYTAIDVLAASYEGPVPHTYQVDYANGGGSDTFTLAGSDWQNGYNGAGTTGTWESIAATATTYNTPGGNHSGNAYVYGYVLPVDPAKVVSDLSLPNDNKVQILAIDLLNQPPQVNLGVGAGTSSPPQTIDAISTDTQPAVSGGGIDGSNDTYSANALGGSALNWNAQTFSLGAAGYNDALAATGQTINLPPGAYTNIELLGTATGGTQSGLSFTVNYKTGNPSPPDYQNFSDWHGNGNTQTGESIALQMSYYNTPSGRENTNTYLYGYVVPVDPTRIVSSITLPSSNGAVKILAINEVSLPPQVNLGNSAGAASMPDNISVLTYNSSTNVSGGGLDGLGDTYSANALNLAIGSDSVVSWNSQKFNLGPVFTSGGVQALASGQTVPLPKGYFNSLQLLGTATGGSAQPVQFTVNYANGSTPFNQTFSDWINGYSGGGTTAPLESLVATMTTHNTPSGNVSVYAYLYGYTINLDSSSEVVSITFPKNIHIDILAINEVNSTQQQQQVILRGGATASGLGAAVAVPDPATNTNSQPSQSMAGSTVGPDLVSMAIEALNSEGSASFGAASSHQVQSPVIGPITAIGNFFGDSSGSGSGLPSGPFVSSLSRGRFRSVWRSRFEWEI